MKKILFLLLLSPFLAQSQILRLNLIADTAAPAPSVIITGTYTSFTTVTGTPSGSQSVTFVGSNLLGSVTFTARTGMQVSSDNSSWGTTAVYTQSGGSNSGTVWARIASATSVGTYNDSIVATSSGLNPNPGVAYSATVTSVPSPSLTVTGSFTNFTTTSGTPSAAQTVTVSGSNLVDDCLITWPTGFEGSLDGSTYSSTRTITHTGGSLSGQPVTVYTRLSNTATGSPSGNITFVSTSANPTKAVTGTVSAGGTGVAWGFSLTAQTMPSGFTNVFGDPSTGLRTSTVNGITLSSTSTSNWYQTSGASASDASGTTGSTMLDFPDNVLLHGWWTFSSVNRLADSAVQTMAKPNFTITGLTVGHSYTIKMVACIASSFTGLSSNNKYRIVGASTYISALYNSKGNTSNEVVFSGVQPDGTGTIKIYTFTESGQNMNLTSGIIIIP